MKVCTDFAVLMINEEKKLLIVTNGVFGSVQPINLCLSLNGTLLILILYSD